jgi:hypothetical protein
VEAGAKVRVDMVARHYHAVCSCGWASPFFDDLEEAEALATYHRPN